MHITSARYTSSEKDVIEAVIDGVSLDVPTGDINNRHYEAILEWVADGNTIQDAD